jgi:hypothetical protein
MDRFDPRLRRTALPEQSTKKKEREKFQEKRESKVKGWASQTNFDLIFDLY